MIKLYKINTVYYMQIIKSVNKIEKALVVSDKETLELIRIFSFWPGKGGAGNCQCSY